MTELRLEICKLVLQFCAVRPHTTIGGEGGYACRRMVYSSARRMVVTRNDAAAIVEGLFEFLDA